MAMREGEFLETGREGGREGMNKGGRREVERGWENGGDSGSLRFTESKNIYPQGLVSLC